MWLYYLLGTLGAIILALLAIVIIRALTFKPKKQLEPLSIDDSIDMSVAISNLQELIKFKTVSYKDTSLEDESQFEGFISALPRLFPSVFEKCTFTRLENRALLFKWAGSEPNGEASVLMSHYDVVPVDEKCWDVPPFEGVIKDGSLWGRGAVDTKATLNGVLTSCEHLIKKGFTPKGDIYFAFSGNEETNGLGAPTIVNYFEENNIKIGLVVDEGGAVVSNVFPGVSEPCAVVGVAEKGMMNVTYKVKTNGGHASSPAPHTPIGHLSKACCDIENNPFKFQLTPPVREMFDTLGRHSTFVYKMIFSNLWLFSGVLNMICKKGGGEINALVRTTVAFTQASGSVASNVIPPEASLVSNIRLNPMDSSNKAIEYLKKTVNNDKVEICADVLSEPSRISRTDCEEYDKVARAIRSTWQGALVTPYLMVQCSDSRHYGRLSDKVYRFSAMDLTKEERSCVHGHNERVHLDAITNAVKFYINLISQL